MALTPTQPYSMHPMACLRHGLYHQRASIAEHERQQRSHHRGLAAAHEHLFDQGSAGAHACDELVHELHLEEVGEGVKGG
eukprot:scaffold14306_cov80-Isochrysis_galbana.AAC.4